MLTMACRLWREDRAEDLIEYGLLAAFVATLATAAIIGDPLGLKSAITGAYQRAIDMIKKA